MPYAFARRALPLTLTLLTLGSTAAVTLPALAADGLQPPAAADLWPTWQTRVTLTLGNTSPQDGAHAKGHLALMGDFYLHRHGLDPAASWRGGFRATSGLLIGDLGHRPGVGSWSSSLVSEMEARPYIGFGYSARAARPAEGDWGFSADLGLSLGQTGAAPELGRALLGVRGWNGLLQRLDAEPVLRFGARYTF